EIKRGLDRRSISYIVLLKESASSADEEILLRQQVFERLNTGGVELENQEIRHCIYHDPFDELLVELSRHEAMRRAWKLPPYSKEEDTNPSDRLLKNPQFSKMRDVEFVLRFFALRHVKYYRAGMQGFLDQYMVRSRRFNDDDINQLRERFTSTIELAQGIYETHLFCPWNPKRNQWAPKPQIAYADAIMVGLSGALDQRQTLLDRRSDVVEATRRLVSDKPKGTFTAQRNTKTDVEEPLDGSHNRL